ncbi:hypothetical protein AgCh_025182 [Apium graveolens]
MFLELGLGNYAAKPIKPILQQSTKEKNDGEQSSEYVMENESGDESDDTSERIISAQKRKVQLVLELVREQMLEIWVKRKQNLEDELGREDVGDTILQSATEVEVVEAGRKRYRGRSKMLKVHGRSAGEKKFVKLSKRGQPIGDQMSRSELINFLGTLVKDHLSLTYVNWHVILDDLKKQMLEYTLERFDIAPEGEKSVYKTLNSSWKTHKSRVKQIHYLQYDNDKERIRNWPYFIPLEDFKMMLKYWSDDAVKKEKDPNHNSPSDAKIYTKSRKRKLGRKYKATTDVVQKKIDFFEEKMKSGNDVDEVIPRKKNRPDWNYLIGLVKEIEKNMDDSEVSQSKVRAKVPVELDRASRSFMRFVLRFGILSLRHEFQTTAMVDLDFPVSFDYLELSVRGSSSSLRLELHLVPPLVLMALSSVMTVALLQAILRYFSIF